MGENCDTIECVVFEQFRDDIENELKLSSHRDRTKKLLEWNEVVDQIIRGAEPTAMNSFPMMTIVHFRMRDFAVSLPRNATGEELLNLFPGNFQPVTCAEINNEINRIRAQFSDVPCTSKDIRKGTSAAVASLLVGRSRDTTINGNNGLLIKADHIYLFLHALQSVNGRERVTASSLRATKRKQSSGDKSHDLKRRIFRDESTIEKIRAFSRESLPRREMPKAEAEVLAARLEDFTRHAVDAYEQFRTDILPRLSRDEKVRILGEDRANVEDLDLALLRMFFGTFFPDPFSAVKRFMVLVDHVKTRGY